MKKKIAAPSFLKPLLGTRRSVGAVFFWAAGDKENPPPKSKMPISELDPPNTPTEVAVCSTMPTMLTLFFYIVMTGYNARKPSVRHALNRRRVTTPEGECAICFAEYVPGSYQLCLPCGHAFHSRCLTRWLARSETCPLCRRSCTAPGPQSP